MDMYGCDVAGREAMTLGNATLPQQPLDADFSHDLRDVSHDGFHDDDVSTASLATVLGSMEDFQVWDMTDLDLQGSDADVYQQAQYDRDETQNHASSSQSFTSSGGSTMTNKTLGEHDDNQMSTGVAQQGFQVSEEWLERARDAAYHDSTTEGTGSKDSDGSNDGAMVSSSVTQAHSQRERTVLQQSAPRPEDGVSSEDAKAVKVEKAVQNTQEWLLAVKGAVAAARRRDVAVVDMAIEQGLDAVRSEVQRLKALRQQG